MTNFLINRRNLIATGSAALAAGASGLVVPAQAKGLAPTKTLRGGANLNEGLAQLEQKPSAVAIGFRRGHGEGANPPTATSASRA